MMLPNGQHYIQTQHISYQNNIPQTVFRNNISSESDHRNAFTPQNNMIMRMVEPTYDIPRYSQPRASSSRSGSNADMLRKID